MKKRLLASVIILCLMLGLMSSFALPLAAQEDASRKVLQRGWRSGVWSEEQCEIEGNALVVPSQFSGFGVEYASYEGKRYLPGSEISLGEGAEVVYFLEGEYYSATQVKSHPDESIYTIATVEELAALAALTSEGYNFDGATLYITADLDFSGYDSWTPIGYLHNQSGGVADAASYPFRGSLNGQGYRFENIDLELDGKFQALFGYVEGATFENIILAEGEMRSSGYRLGALASLFKNGQARNIESHISLYSSATEKNLNMGLFALTHGVTVERVAVYGTIGDPNLKTEQQNGGISGCGYDNNTTIQYSFVPAKINGLEVFQIGQRCIIKNCPLVGSKEMPYADFISGKAAWILNTAGGTTENSGLWSAGEGGPTMMGSATYRLETIAITEAGDEISVSYEYYDQGADLLLKAPDGYTLKEIKDEHTNILSGAQKMPPEDQTLYLICLPKEYSIGYDLNGGEAKEPLGASHSAGEKTPLAAGDLLEKEGYVFGGWYEQADFSGAPLAEIPADRTRDSFLYAKWNEPMMITDADQLCALAEGDLSGAYCLGADIDLTDKDFAPIGSSEAPFTGSFDGNGYTISGLKIESKKNYQGLFGYNEGYICNVTLAEDCVIKGNNYVGGIAGFNGGTVTGCITAAAVEGSLGGSTAKQYSIMSQNLCVWGNQYDIEAVSTRQPWMVKRIKEQNADFLGFQECSPTWVDYISTNIADTYTFMYKYREPSSSSSNESSAVAFKTADFDLLDSGYFWLSETPDVCSKGWDAGHWRICHWMYLRDKENGQKIGVFNTHFDLTDTSKLGGANVMHSRLLAAMEANPDMAIVACGDFNSEEGTAPYRVMTSDGFLDSRYASPITTDEYTHTKGAGWGDGVRSIDYVFGHEERVIFDEFDVLNELSETGKRLSDHNGVLARFRAMSGNYIGGAVGANDGSVDFIFTKGSANGTSSIGAVVGQNNGAVNHFYASATEELDFVGEGEEPQFKDKEKFYDYSNLYFLWRLNRQAERKVFTLQNESAAICGNRGLAAPVQVTEGENNTYHLSGSSYTMNTQGFADPICSLDGIYQQSATVTLPERDCIAAVQENINCTQHLFGEWKPLDAAQHQKICSKNPAHTQTADHRWSEALSDGAGCSVGTADRYCLDCGYEQKSAGGAVSSHLFGEWKSDDDQIHYRSCEREESHKEYLPHRFDQGAALSASCEVGGGTLYTCLDCGYEKIELSALPLGHRYGSLAAGEGCHQRICERDNTHLWQEEHRWAIEENGSALCLDCGEEWVPETCENAGHKYGDWEYLNASHHIRFCERDRSHQAIGTHEYDEGTYVPVSCTEDEHIRYECAVCHHIKKEKGDEIAYGHSYGEWEQVQQPDANQNGLYARECGRCHNMETRVIPNDNAPAFVAKLQEMEEGGKVVVDIILQNNPGLSGFGLEIGYDPQDFALSEQEALVWGAAGKAMDLKMSNVDEENGLITLTAISVSDEDANGVVATLCFNMKETFGRKGLITVKVQPRNTIDGDFQRVEIYDRDLLIELDHCRHHLLWNEDEGAYICGLDGCEKRWACRGDVDGDGKLTTADPVLVMRHLVEGVAIDAAAADFNSNQSVGISDAVLMLRFLSDQL